MPALTYLSLPRICPVLLGLLWVASGFSAPAQGPHLEIDDASLSALRSDQPIDAYYTPGVSDTGRLSFANFSPGSNPSTARRSADGSTSVTIHFENNDGKKIEWRTAVLVLNDLPAPEPTPTFFGACAGCVFLLLRRRAEPSKLRHARVNLSAAVAARGRSLPPARAITSRPAQAPKERRVPRRHRPALGHDAYTARLFPRQPRLSRP